MTKVEDRYELAAPLSDGALLAAIDRAHGIYGLTRVRLTPSMDGLDVEYDASRLTPDEVASALRRSGLPVRRRPPV